MLSNIRLKFFGLRQRYNFGFIRLLLVFIYVIAMLLIIFSYLGGSAMNDMEEIELDKDTVDVINNINPPQHFKADRKDFVNQVEENEVFNPRDKDNLVVAENSWINKVPDKIKETVPGREDGKFVAIGDWNGDFRNTDFKQDTSIPEKVRAFEAGFVDGLGEKGGGVHLSAKDRELAQETKKRWAFNKVASDQISLWRSLTDKRLSKCQSIEYDDDLPTASVIIIFNNEALSALLRTVWSVLDRTEPNLLHEIILVDDASNQTEITDILPSYIKYRFPTKVGMVRTATQQGLIRARLAGAKVASGDVLVFLDSHCEATKGWYEPMAQRIKDDNTVVQIPRIDGIDATSISYYGSGGTDVQVGGFTWSGHFTWESQPRQIRETRKVTDPARTATMAGGLFAMDRKFFFHVGAYDEGMAGWGGENLEMSFRIWRCGGSMEIHPCSHVGHIFRDFHPYFIPEDSHGINSVRMAEVWMDDYKRFYYMHRQDLLGKNVGDLTERFQLKERLQCKSFRWFLDNVYSHKFILDEDAIAWGRIRNKKEDQHDICFDHLQRDQAGKKVQYVLGEYPCHNFLGDSQYFTLSELGELRNEYMCATASTDYGKSNKVQMVACPIDGARLGEWELNRLGQIFNKKKNLCISSGERGAGEELSLEECDNVPNQTWHWEFYGNKFQHFKLSVP